MVTYITYESSNYEVGSDGSVRNIKGRVLKSCADTSGYLQVSIKIGDKWFRKSVHRLVAETHHADTRRPDFEVDHKNRDKSDNNTSNLRWVSKKTNSSNKGNYKQQSKHLTKEQHKEFISRYMIGDISIYKITKWANLQFGRTSSLSAYAYILRGTRCKKFWYALSRVERDSVQAITLSRNKNK